MKFRNQIGGFLLIGLISTFLNYLIFITLYKLTNNITLSSYMGYFVGLINSFIFGKNFVFRESNRNKVILFALFGIVYLLGGLLMSLLILFFINIGFEYRLAWLFGLTLSVINNFLGSKYLVFK